MRTDAGRLGLLFVICLTARGVLSAAEPAPPLQAGFAEADVTPTLGAQPVYMAGFGQNRKATAVHDKLLARVVVLAGGGKKIAVASLDLVGFFLPNVEAVRARLPGFDYVLVSSTHNHEGPDTLGLWGPTPFASGVDPAYLKRVEDRLVEAVGAADRALRPVVGRVGSAHAPELLRDGREPYVKHDELTVLQLLHVGTDRPAGLVVQWHCHPETLDSKNTEISADFVGYTVAELRRTFDCPIVYLTGTVGGLMTSLGVEVRDDQGRPLKDGTFEKTERYGRLVAEAARRAVRDSRPAELTPLAVHRRELYLPMQNPLYRLGRQLGVLQRDAYHWTGDARKAGPLEPRNSGKPLCLRTEIAWLRLGELDVAAVPGEIYPELVLGQVQDPTDPAADFPDAPIESALYAQLPGRFRMLVGLANDEIGYIIPKRQWDEKAPFCYGRKKTQYGEVNSIGPEAAPLLCEAFRELVKGK